MSVDLPSSTEPAVAKRRSSAITPRPLLAFARPMPTPSEVALLLPVFHARLADAVVRSGRAALCEAGGGDLEDDVVDGRGRRLHATGAGGIADGAEAHLRLEHVLAVLRRDERPDGEQHAVAAEHLAVVRVVDRGDLDGFVGDVLPDVELGPVAQREDPDVLALAMAAVVERPQLGPLVLRIPLAELVAEREHPLLRPGLLLVAAGAAEHGVVAALLDRAQERRGLQPVPARADARLLGDHAGIDVVLH